MMQSRFSPVHLSLQHRTRMEVYGLYSPSKHATHKVLSRPWHSGQRCRNYCTWHQDKCISCERKRPWYTFCVDIIACWNPQVWSCWSPMKTSDKQCGVLEYLGKISHSIKHIDRFSQNVFIYNARTSQCAVTARIRLWYKLYWQVGRVCNIEESKS